MNITISVPNFSTNPTNSELSFILYINDNSLVQEIKFVGITSVGSDSNVLVTSTVTVGRTILLRLNANDTLSIKVNFTQGNITFYQAPSLVVIRIAD
ncbi:hypothetical protein [Bacillus toyonensis]|uniref:Uncharacterized protein n=1 Tax=Bacillus toyonensis TaxID=155322 RepID=A0AB73R3P9_9BACI|nr:hypothetical protein [Bacillus toyonensis]PEI83430.1 hypothetical protein CN678_24285 [Bacillus toyonensis]